MIRVTSVAKLPPRSAQGHKGLFGRVLVIGGNRLMIGAPVLAGTAALRMGSGLVQVAMPRTVVPAALSVTPELIGLALDSVAGLKDAVDRADVIVLGPGLGQSSATRRIVTQIVKIEKPMVIDADALNILAMRWPRSFKAHAVLTPHPGEMKRLTAKDVPPDDDGRIALAAQAATNWGVVMVLKGHRTVVTDGQRVFLNDTGDSSLSKGGTGDVLSGMIGSLLGQKMDRFDAACAAVRLHGLAGEAAGRKLGRRSVLARDVIHELPAVIEESQPQAP